MGTEGTESLPITSITLYRRLECRRKNTAGWELKTGPEGITSGFAVGGEKKRMPLTNVCSLERLQSHFAKGGLPQWTLALEEDCQISDTDYIEAGTVALCKVTMEKSAPIHFTRGELPDRVGEEAGG